MPKAIRQWSTLESTRPLRHYSPSPPPPIPPRTFRPRLRSQTRFKFLEQHSQEGNLFSSRLAHFPPHRYPPPSLQSLPRLNCRRFSRPVSPARPLRPLHRHRNLPYRFLSPRLPSTTRTTFHRFRKTSSARGWRVERRGKRRTSTLELMVDRISTAYTSRRSTPERRIFWDEESEFTTSSVPPITVFVVSDHLGCAF